jgi:hypothetical protein
MKASSRKQLNVRSDEAYAIAHELADKRGKSTTEIVVTALRNLKGARTIPSTKVTPEEADENFRRIMEGVREANRLHPSGLSSNHDYLYDENGLPK